jgi:hypothetical protein
MNSKLGSPAETAPRAVWDDHHARAEFNIGAADCPNHDWTRCPCDLDDLDGGRPKFPTKPPTVLQL